MMKTRRACLGWAVIFVMAVWVFPIGLSAQGTKVGEKIPGEKEKEYVAQDVKRAIAGLASEDPFTVEDAKETLLYTGSEAVPALLEVLKPVPAPGAPKHPQYRLTEITPGELEAIQTSHPEVRFLACDLLGQMGDRRAIPALLPLLKDKTDFAGSLASFAARALGLLHARRAIPDLTEALKSDDAELKYEALKALGYLHARSAIPEVEKLLTDMSQTYYKALIRAQAALTLAFLRAADSVEKIKPLLKDAAVEENTERPVNYYAAKALGELLGRQAATGNLDGSPQERTEAITWWQKWASSKEITKESKKKETPHPVIPDKSIPPAVEKK